MFYTPPELAILLKSYISDAKEIYDPTCWDWQLLCVFGDDIIKYGQEINPNQLDEAKKIPNFIWYCWDTLCDDWFIEKKFDRIIANPPFSIKWEQVKTLKYNIAWVLPPPSKADYAFILHILDKLSDRWMAVILSFPWVLYRWSSEWIIRKRLVDNNYIERIVHIPWKTFVDTTIATCIICIRKNRNTKDIIFEDKELSKETVITVDEVSKNDYCLSVSRYIVEEKEKINIDPLDLMRKARNEFVLRLRKDVEFDRQVCLLEWWDFNIYIDWLIKEIQKYKIR